MSMVQPADLIGSWDLVRVDLIGPGSESLPPAFGGKPQGVLHYMADGRMVAIIQSARREAFAGGRRGATDADWRRAGKSFTAYAGDWELRGDRVIHHVDFNSYPNDVGVDYIRHARIEGGLLVLETPIDGPPDSRPMRLIWKRKSAR
ncbi:MAG TPA: lipocalin-like domain-containing protein [Novosphingobium sp.]|nr:lipocalin-like domain-containing protein [Novosphingobium sp.]